MTVLAPNLRCVDVQIRRIPAVIGTAVFESADGVTLVDPGPTSCLPVLLADLETGGVGVKDVRAILLTHIHLDHAGATGTLLRENPAIHVYVHERGTPHLIDPERLLASATRLYGAAMDELWGAFLPVPADAITSLAGGERLSVGGRSFQVQYTPGHASHHVSYLDEETRIAFVGDTAGIRIPPSSFVLAPTPPPDIDIELWLTSIDRIAAWHPRALFLTHFGLVETPVPHLQQVAERLQEQASLARQALEMKVPEPEQRRFFVDTLLRNLHRQLPAPEVQRYELAVAVDLCWFGLVRYWKHRGVPAASDSR